MFSVHLALRPLQVTVLFLVGIFKGPCWRVLHQHHSHKYKLMEFCNFFTISEDRIRNGAKKLQKSKQKATQGRLDMFFKPVASPIAGQKRKVVL